jgi:hypothetical protein
VPSVYALVFADLRFPDGHVERWFGPGRLWDIERPGDDLPALVRAGEELADEEADDMRNELRMSFTCVPDRLPGGVEVVVEWNHTLDVLN